MKTDHRLYDRAMTQTIQTHSICTIKKTEKTKLTEAEEIACDIFSVCDSLNKLHDTLIRLEYVIREKNIETGLTERSV
jgi:hypothetical protein